jgi:hypothetical protein
LADILLGAIGYDWNEHSTSPAKMELKQHIAHRLGRNTLRFTTSAGAPKVNIWQWQPSESTGQKRKPRPGP